MADLRGRRASACVGQHPSHKQQLVASSWPWKARSRRGTSAGNLETFDHAFARRPCLRSRHVSQLVAYKSDLQGIPPRLQQRPATFAHCCGPGASRTSLSLGRSTRERREREAGGGGATRLGLPQGAEASSRERRAGECYALPARDDNAPTRNATRSLLLLFPLRRRSWGISAPEKRRAVLERHCRGDFIAVLVQAQD